MAGVQRSQLHQYQLPLVEVGVAVQCGMHAVAILILGCTCPHSLFKKKKIIALFKKKRFAGMADSMNCDRFHIAVSSTDTLTFISVPLFSFSGIRLRLGGMNKNNNNYYYCKIN